MSMEESISLEETNRIRISIGLKPLTDDNAPANDNEQEAEANYAKVREEAAKEKQKKTVQDRIAKVRNRRELNASLSGVTLGDADKDVDDTVKWIKRAKKREKELARKRQEELDNMDKTFQEEYGEKDLAGLKVSHNFEDMDEGEAKILTLKDSRILDNEEDELQNVEMAEEDRRKKNQEMKIKRRDYTGYDDDEFTTGNAGAKRAILAKYDEVLEGAKETSFRLGAPVTSSDSRLKEEERAAAAVNKSLLSIDYAKNIDTADYFKEGDVGFKKPKTKKKRSSRRIEQDPELQHISNGDAMEIVEKPIVPRPRNIDANFVDDDELQSALARSRRAKIKKAKKLSPEEIAQKIVEGQVRRDSENGPEVINVEDDGEADEDGGLTIDDTSEFVRSITFDPNAIRKEREVKKEAAEPAVPRAKSEARSDIVMGDGDEIMEELEAGEVRVKEEDEEDEETMLHDIENAIREQEEEEKKVAAQQTEVDIGTSSESTFSGGMASTLNLLRQQGILAAPKADTQEREMVQKQRDLWLAEQRRRLAERELERLKARGAPKDQATREYENRLREQQEAREQLEMFKNYKPDVNIVYYDEFGRQMTVKEAWKALSHKFHGKGSGKMKTEKRLKKIAEEKKKAAMASGDTPLSMNRAFQMRQEKTGQAHFVLSVGNRGAVPQAEAFLDTPQLAKGKTEKTKAKKKEKESKNASNQEQGFITLPAPISNNPSPAPLSPALGSGMASHADSPAPRPGFKSITSSASVFPAIEGKPSSSGDRMKVALSLKRKAGEEAKGSPPPKRR
ncbi:SART-1 protein [Neolentinus lepideus HHB14362 ss-1]|uniref:SART-1 protein n=1 Tax=Neolentinus lepideus HHB14362 ss-1 TaxID=1314782 RepID=A0A165NV27_9AGAM|nr:SART-1 protein [Neolentinus lepideus HHB14362 ss-1]